MIQLHAVFHPLVILRDVYLEESDITIAELAERLDVSISELNQFMSGQLDVSRLEYELT
jgi:plasmid maintenance system antidote protein VapI